MCDAGVEVCILLASSRNCYCSTSPDLLLFCSHSPLFLLNFFCAIRALCFYLLFLFIFAVSSFSSHISHFLSFPFKIFSRKPAADIFPVVCFPKYKPPYSYTKKKRSTDFDKFFNSSYKFFYNVNVMIKHM